MRTTFNLLLIIFLCISLQAVGQKPTIVSVDKENGAVKEIVTIKGSDFGTDPAKLKVFFGAAAGNIKEVTNQLMEVQAPAGTTYDNISVTNTTNGLTGYSPSQFGIRFNGDHGLSAASFSAETDFDAEKGLYDLCLCDFNGDNKVDIATASDISNSLSIFQNGSTVATISLSRINFLINAKSLHATCGDLNGDGKPDMIVSEGSDGDRIYIFRNTGSFGFSIQPLKLTGRKVKRIAIADLDLDGKPEVVVTDKGSNIITVLPNQSTVSSITFGTALTFSIQGATSTDALEVKDINGNGLPEIIVSQFLTASSNIFISDNKSSPGTFNFTDVTTLSIASTVVNVRVGDLDGDQKPDIALTRLLGSDISVFLNQSTSTQTVFSEPVSIATATRPWGIDFGDLDGDGKTDIVVGSISDKSLTVLNNKSSAGNLSFETMLPISTTFINRHVKIGDLNGDGKPDIAFTSIDDNNANIPSSKISVFRNKSCFIPVLSPTGPLSICIGFPLKLTSSISEGSTYDWQKDGSPTPGGDPSLDITVTGAYTVTASSEAGSCTKTSNAVSITVSTPGAGLTATDPDARSNSPVCTENALNLAVTSVNATEYRWRGPNGFTATGLNPVLNNFSLENAGLYIVEMIAGTCIAKIDSTIVEAITNPDFTITFSGSSLICQGSPKTLTISPVLTSGFTYQWFEKAQGSIGGATNSTFAVASSGDYSAKVTSANPGCAPVETPEIKLTLVAIPDAEFTLPGGTGCAGQALTFTNQSTVDPLATASYKWIFGDAIGTSTEASPKYTYTQAGTFAVKLRVTYQGESCPNEETKSISILKAPAAVITTTFGKFNICPNDTLRLVASGDIFTAFAWSTGETTPFIIINEPGDYFVNATNSSGCTMNASETVSAVTPIPVTASADKDRIKVGQTTMLTATGLESYLWQPGISLSDSTSSNPIATPLQNITYTVSGRDINECYGEASIEITVLGSTALNLITPSNFFSPNEDAINPYWTIKDIESFPQCEVSIFNDKGAKVFQAKPYANNWDGTFKGSNLPGGVYYYAIRCDGDANVKTGSITLLK